jgi:hypothetical protein
MKTKHLSPISTPKPLKTKHHRKRGRVRFSANCNSKRLTFLDSYIRKQVIYHSKGLTPKRTQKAQQFSYPQKRGRGGDTASLELLRAARFSSSRFRKPWIVLRRLFESNFCSLSEVRTDERAQRSDREVYETCKTLESFWKQLRERCRSQAYNDICRLK